MKTRRIFHTILSVTCFMGALALVGFATWEAENTRYSELRIEVEEIDGMYLVDDESVLSAILEHDSIVGSFHGDVSLAEVEQWVRERLPAVQNVQVYAGLDRSLQVQVTQRRPIARWHDTSEAHSDQYLDDQGELMPLSPVFTARVPVIFASNEQEVETAYAFIKLLEAQPVWHAFTDGLVVDGNVVELIPRLGSARIALGDLATLPKKLNHLDAFYREQIARGNLNEYKHISLEYDGQIVAQRFY